MKKYYFTLPLLFILILSYWRYTYILHPNFNGEPFLIEINKTGWPMAANSKENILSIIIYWLLFLLGNVTLFIALFKHMEKVKLMIMYYLLISFLSGLFFVVDVFWLNSTAFFRLGSILKNFLLSPVFTATGYIMIAYYQKGIKSS